ncbi:hypothetical protein KAJ87_00525 [Candidatus Pacearchaeota archaeon]|nr:hypothetical protein [Candidatus Pacearchaeota archaeon]
MAGDDYQRTVEELKEKIRKGTLIVLDGKALEAKTKVGCLCYFCRKHIYGKVNVLVNPSEKRILVNQEEKRISMSSYPVHDKCYEEAKR